MFHDSARGKPSCKDWLRWGYPTLQELAGKEGFPRDFWDGSGCVFALRCNEKRGNVFSVCGI